MIGRRTVMGGAILGGAALSGSAGRGVAAQPVPIVVDAPCGPLRGLKLGSTSTFLGIPYAAPPVGSARYAPPRPMARWSELRDATRAGAASIQTLGGAAGWLYEQPDAMSEDCLFLNVTTPGIVGRRPVMVWLHGGAWRTGEGNAAGTRGGRLAEDGDVVVVTVNYRLGALGWLAHPALADPETGAAANWGLQDQVAALRWVQANIAAFGGDPGRVTLFGQSAGGSSTASIIQDPRHAGLVHRAILESASLHGAPGFPEMPTAARYTEALAAALNVDVPGLRSVEALRLHQAELALGRDPAMVRSLGRPPVLPVLDGVVLKAWPRDAPMAAIPILIGTTATEATFWYDLVAPDGTRVPGLKPPADTAQLETMTRDLAAIYRPEGTSQAAMIVPLYAALARRLGVADDPLSLWIAIYTDVVFRLRAIEAARRHATAGHPTWRYEFNHALASPAHGVPHTAEIPFVFGTYTDPFFEHKSGTEGPEHRLSIRMLGDWARFAHESRMDQTAQGAGMAPGFDYGTMDETAAAAAWRVRVEVMAGWGI